MKYESEILYDLMKRDGLLNPSQDNLPYESELKEKYVNDVVGAYPKLQDYRPEWLNYNKCEYIPADFPTESQTNQTSGMFENVIPFAYDVATLKGSTKYRDIDTEDILDTFDETKNLKLVSVKMPVLTTTGKNLYSYGDLTINNPKSNTWYYTNGKPSSFGSSCKRTDGGNWFYLEKGAYSYQSINENCQINISLVGEGEKIYASGKEIPSGWYVFRFKTKSEAVDYAKISQLQLEKGSNKTTYEPYKTIILTVNEEVELRGIGDVEDTLDLTNGVLTQRVGEIVLDGSTDEFWELQSINRYGIANFRTNVNAKDFSDLICEQLPMSSEAIADTSTENIRMTQNKALYIRKKATVASTVSELRQFLASNPITVQYQLKTESVKTVDLSCINEDNVECDFIPIMNTMHYQTSSNTIPPLVDLTVCVEATTQNLASFVNLEGVEHDG